jgi:hypothetical protein
MDHSATLHPRAHCLMELSGRLWILGWFSLATLTLGILCGVLAARAAVRRARIPLRRLDHKCLMRQ